MSVTRFLSELEDRGAEEESRVSEDQLDIKGLPREATEQDQWIFERVTTERLAEDQSRRIVEPDNIYPRQREVVALHWHPEFVPVELIRQRIERMFPHKEEELIIPTQHNVLTSYGQYTGVEVDCFSDAFHRKVQLLIHFQSNKIEGRGDVFRGMLDHTFRYRTSQLYQFVETILHPEFDHHVQEAAEKTGTNDALVEFTRIYVRRIMSLIEKNERQTAPEMIRNKLLVNFFDMLRSEYNDRLINHVQIFLRAVKGIVKRHFSLDYFYKHTEVIEEAKALGAGIVVPHPEQFWPILLEDLPIDGIEVWNPQSFEFTEFLINVVNRENRTRARSDRPILVTMGDDCHMGEKVKDPRYRDVPKAAREIGVQPPWDDMNLRKSLIVAGSSRESLIREYKARLQ